MSKFYGNQLSKLKIESSTESPPVQDTWYTILDTTLNIRIVHLSVGQTNDETNAKNIETEITLDGTDYGRSQSYDDSVYYSQVISYYSEQLIHGTTGYSAGRYTDLPAQSAKVRIRLTSAAGTNQTLTGRIWYNKY